MRYITVLFSLATAVLFAHSFAAPITSDLSILPHPSYQGQTQQDSVPVDPGFGDYFDKIYRGLLEVITKSIENSDRDPKKVELVRKYAKDMRTFVTPFANFVRQYYPHDIAANNIFTVSDNFLSSLEKLVEEPSVSRKDTANLAKLMRIIEVVKSW